MTSQLASGPTGGKARLIEGCSLEGSNTDDPHSFLNVCSMAESLISSVIPVNLPRQCDHLSFCMACDSVLLFWCQAFNKVLIKGKKKKISWLLDIGSGCEGHPTALTVPSATFRAVPSHAADSGCCHEALRWHQLSPQPNTCSGGNNGPGVLKAHKDLVKQGREKWRMERNSRNGDGDLELT